ncbi:MAG TPA: hypothetical protein VF167_18350, partial [Longimicrobiaceae bacterium]
RFVSRGGKGWITVALGAWVLVGLLGESGGWVEVVRRGTEQVAVREAVHTGSAGTSGRGANAGSGTAGSARTTGTPALSPTAVAGTDTAPSTPPALAALDSSHAGTESNTDSGSLASTQPEPTEQGAAGQGSAEDTVTARDSAASEAPPSPPTPPDAPWMAITQAHIDALDFSDLPPDEGVVAPIASRDDLLPYPELAEELECLRTELLRWEPAAVRDPVQRARNLLMVAAVPDATQMEWLEPWVPLEIFDYLRADIHEPHLSKILYWIITHPNEGDDSAADQLRPLCIDVQGRAADTQLLRERVALYAMKLLGRLQGKIRVEGE